MSEELKDRLPEALQYRNDTGLPSITEIIGGKLDRISGVYSLRGTLVHYGIELVMKGDDVTKAEDICHDVGFSVAIFRGYMDGLYRFQDSVTLEPRLIEHRLDHETLFFTGKLDYEGLLNGRDAIVDFKSGSHPQTAPIQTAAQELLVKQIDGKPRDRYALVLDGKGDFKLKAHKSSMDVFEFMKRLGKYWEREAAKIGRKYNV